MLMLFKTNFLCLFSFKGMCNLKGKRSKTSTKRLTWSLQEIEAVERHLVKYILTETIPGADAIRKCMDEETILKNRTWKNVKDFVRNRIVSIQRKKKNSNLKSVPIRSK